MIVLGVDPGSQVTGYGLIKTHDHEEMTCIGMGRITSPAKTFFHNKIYNIFKLISQIIADSRPNQMALEDIFYAKNARSSLQLGHARGAVMVAAGRFDLPIFQYAPLEVKKSVTGFGGADKKQVRSMVEVLLGLDPLGSLDISDALAVALCHINRQRFDDRVKQSQDGHTEKNKAPL